MNKEEKKLFDKLKMHYPKLIEENVFRFEQGRMVLTLHAKWMIESIGYRNG